MGTVEQEEIRTAPVHYFEHGTRTKNEKANALRYV